jgi:hypothetical protein
MTDDNNKEKKISSPSLRAYDKREAQRKSLKEKEMEDAIAHQELVEPKIYYEDNEVNDIHIWLDMLDHYCTIYIGPFISKDGKQSEIGLRYTIDSSEHANISNDPKDEIISDWTVRMFEKISVKYNKLNTGITIEKFFGVKGVGDYKLEKSMYIPMSRIYHIVTNENPHNKDIIEK